MKYDFTSILERKGKDAIAVDCAPGYPKDGFDMIPMWVADMNFPTAPSIISAMQERVAHPAFGYFEPTADYFQSIVRWHEKRNGVSGLKPGHIGYENGVLGGVVSALNVLAAPGDPILLHSPTYIGFTFSLREAGFNIILSDLVQDEDGVWRMDYEDMERKIRRYGIKAAIFCNPHNPCGRVWEREELEKAMEVYRKHDVYVVSDEIWSDLILDGNKHIPLQSVNEDARNRVVAMYAPSKTFNLAGLIGSYHIIYNNYLNKRITAQGKKGHYNSMNVLSMHALIGAYSPEGEEWVDELCQVLTENVDYAYRFIVENFEGVTLAKPEGTYMLFLDCTRWCDKNGKTLDELLRAGWDVGVIWQDGRPFHGACSIRMNLAVPTSRVVEAFDRLKQYVF